MSEARHSSGSGQRTSKCEKFSDLYHQKKIKIKKDSFLFSILILKTIQITYNQNLQLKLPSSLTQ